MNGCLVASLTLIFAASVAVHEEFIRLAQNAEQKGISSALSNHGKPVILWRLTARARALDGPGLGEGRTALALAQVSWRVFFVLVEPNKEALSRALARSHGLGLRRRTLAAVGRAESLPFTDNSVDLVISQAPFFLAKSASWGAGGPRVLRPGGKTMIGGGLGSAYP